jgi:fructose-specific phosphotransferase system IIA component
MHNNKKYLEEVLAITCAEGISEVSIFERKGLAKSLYGTKRDLFPSMKPLEIMDEFDYALIAAVPGEEKIEQLKKLILTEPRLYPLTESGLMFTLPYNNIKRLFKKDRGDEEAVDLARITEERVCLDLSATDKAGVIREMIEVLGNHDRIRNKEELLKGLQAREQLETTGIGDGVALPHARTDIVKELMVAFGRSKKGVEFEALDDKPVHLVFLIVAPRKDSSKVMKLLAGFCRILGDEGFRQALLAAETKREVVGLIEGKSSHWGR